jgi:putative SOS response-associated peptidase YedK
MMTWAEVAELYHLLLDYPAPQEGLKPRFNAAPTDTMPVARLDSAGAREIAFMRWGLIPSWAKEARIGASMINARAESLTDKPAFRNAFRQRRCLVPADGFYEWIGLPDGRKQPFRIILRDSAPFSFAGIWESWRRGGQVIESFAIVTCPANELMAKIHDRMPVILDRADYAAWLESKDTTIPNLLLQPYPAEKMKAYPVSMRVNSVRNDDRSLIELVAEPPTPKPQQQALF